MLALLLCSVASSALIAGQGDFLIYEDTLITLNPSEVDANFYFSPDQTEIRNTSNSEVKDAVRAVKPIIPSMGDTYWEVHMNSISTDNTFNGYVGVLSQNQVDDPSFGFGSDTHPVYFGSIGYRGNGRFWSNGSEVSSAVDYYGTGDVIMLSFNAKTGRIRVGKNGVWSNFIYNSIDAGGIFWPYVQGRDKNEGGRLVSLPDEFAYPIPFNHHPLSRTYYFYNIDIAKSYGVLGGKTDHAAVYCHKAFMVFGGRANGIRVNESKTYAIIEV